MPMPNQIGNLSLMDALLNHANNQSSELTPNSQAEFKGGLMEHLTQQVQKPLKPVDNIFEALRSMNEKC